MIGEIITLILKLGVTAWTIFMFLQILSVINEYGEYSGLVVVFLVVVWYAVAWIPILFLNNFQ